MSKIAGENGILLETQKCHFEDVERTSNDLERPEEEVGKTKEGFSKA